MVKLINLPNTVALLGVAGIAQAGYQKVPCTPPQEGESDPCNIGKCVETYENSGEYQCIKMVRKLHKVMNMLPNTYEEIKNRPDPKNGSPTEKPIEFRNTATHCSIPKQGVVYTGVDVHWQPIVEKCWHNPSGNEVKIRNDTVGVSKQNCKLRCPDHRMDPVFFGKNKKDPTTGKPQYIHTRVFQISCNCNEGKKGPGYCGWQTTGSGIKEFAGGNLACDYTFFAVKPIWAPDSYAHKDTDLEIVGSYAADQYNRNKKAIYAFDSNNIKISYYIIRREWDEDQQKHIKVELPLDDEGKTLERDGHRNYYSYVNDVTGLQMYPTDLIMQNENGKNENQPNKAGNSLNIRAKISCHSHTGDRYFATLEPWCKNQRHALKKGRPGDCAWRIENLWPNHEDSFINRKDKTNQYHALGFDPEYTKIGKAKEYRKNEAKKSGVGNKKAESLVREIQMGSRYWRCSDFVENQKQD